MCRGMHEGTNESSAPPVQGDVHDVGFGVQDLLDAVAMVHIPVEHEHSGGAGRVRGQRGDGNIVEEAEAHSTRALCVVPRRPHHRKRALHSPAAHRLHRLQRASRSVPYNCFDLFLHSVLYNRMRKRRGRCDEHSEHIQVW